MGDEAPLYYNEKYDFYAVSRYGDVREMSADWRTYSSAKGSVLELIDAGPEVLEIGLVAPPPGTRRWPISWDGPASPCGGLSRVRARPAVPGSAVSG